MIYAFARYAVILLITHTLILLSILNWMSRVEVGSFSREPGNPMPISWQLANRLLTGMVGFPHLSFSPRSIQNSEFL